MNLPIVKTKDDKPGSQGFKNNHKETAMKAHVKKTTEKSQNNSTISTVMAATAIALAFAFITFTPNFSDARGFKGKGRQHDPQEISTWLAESLELTEEQQASIQPIIEDKIQTREELRKQHQEEREQTREIHRSEMEEIDQETAAQLSGILTADQMEKYTEMKEKHRSRMEEKRERRQENRKSRRSENQ